MVTADDLVEKSKSELDELFLEAETPEEGALDGETEGRVLAGRGLLRVGPVRDAVNTPFLPWKGKHIERGLGSNRFGYGPLERHGFEFETEILPSLVPEDDDDVVVFDYDQPENPPGIRRIRDDLKEVEDGLFLGTSNIEVGDGYRFLIYFALEQVDSAAEQETAEIEIK